MQRGALVGTGRTAEVFEFGSGRVVKLLRSGIPAAWAVQEAELTAAVHARGLPTPAVHDIVELDGRAGVIFERIDGPSMWTGMLASDEAADRLARSLASMHLEILAELAPTPLPSLIARTTDKVAAATSLSSSERLEAKKLAAGLDEASGLCHGDMHPGNIILAATGPVVIDWYDAAAGSPTADVVRTSLLIRPSPEGQRPPVHLPGATGPVLCAVHRGYLETVMAGRTVAADQIRTWERVLAASRLAEQAEPDESQLVALWRDRGLDGASHLVDELRQLGLLDDGPDGLGHAGS